jgi:hypothetical protein
MRLAMAVGLALLPWSKTLGAELTVVGTAHLSQLQPVPDQEQLGRVVDALAAWRPTLVCIEAIPGERVQDFMGDPARHGPLLATFAPIAVRLGSEQQVRRQLGAAAARNAALELVRSDPPLAQDDALRLVSLHLAGYEPWSAALVWSGMTPDQREGGAGVLGRRAVEALDALLDSPDEIARIALPTARRLGHRQLCHADTFQDELPVAALGPALMTMLQDPSIADGIAAFNAESSARWNHRVPEGLLGLLGWMQTGDFARRDRATQWDVFATDPAAHDAGERRLALWHARNAEITAHLYRALSQPEGGRVLLLIGAAHRPFLEASIAAQPWIRLTPAGEWLTSP